MTCPRCGNQWDVSKSPCSRCGLLVHLPGRFGATRNTASASQQQAAQTPPPTPSNASPITQQPGFSPQLPTPSTSMPPPTPRMGRDGNGIPGASYPTSPETAQARSGIGEFGASPFMPQTPYPGTSYRGTEIGSIVDDSMPARRPQTDMLEMGGVNPSQPASMPPPRARVTNQPLADSARAQSPLRPSRLVNERNNPPVARMASFTAGPDGSVASDLSGMGNATASPAFVNVRMLMPGTVLRGGRYRLQEQQERQMWTNGAFEAWWSAQDAQRSSSSAEICEIVVPDSQSMLMQSTLRSATMALTSVGRHPYIPTLWDVFNEQGRNFFVFEPSEGESLMARMRRTGRALSEADVVECCLQMTELLDLLSQQSPPLVHGLIRPEHIVIARANGHYLLTHFSILLAGGSTQFITGIERIHLSPYTSPEFARGVVDVRSDLYALLATAYHVVTGSLPSALSGSIPSAQRLNPTVSPQFEAILAKGLRSNASQRYQRPSELRQELLAMNSVHGSLAPASVKPFSMQPMQSQTHHSVQSSMGPIEQFLPSMMSSVIDDFEAQDRQMLLPQPEELAPMVERNDTQIATFWIVGILLLLIVLIVFSRGLM